MASAYIQLLGFEWGFKRDSLKDYLNRAGPSGGRQGGQRMFPAVGFVVIDSRCGVAGLSRIGGSRNGSATMTFSLIPFCLAHHFNKLQNSVTASRQHVNTESTGNVIGV